MTWNVSITLEGTPGLIQLIADAVDQALPGAVEWQDHAKQSVFMGHIVVRGSGFGAAVVPELICSIPL